MKYAFNVSFQTDRKLTDLELEQLQSTIELQIIEPQAMTEDGDYNDATYSTCCTTIERITP